jgi:hypothetical protein
MRDVAFDEMKRKSGMKIEKDIVEDKSFGRKKGNGAVWFSSV